MTSAHWRLPSANLCPLVMWNRRVCAGCIHFREVGISVGAAWSALRSRIHRLYLLYQHSPIYSCWFCCGPYPCGVCWGISTASTSDLWPGANCSLVGIGSFARCCFADRCSSHNVSLAVWGGCDSGWTSWRKLFLDFRRLGAGWWLWQGWRVSSACLLRFSPAGYRSANARWGDTSQDI